MHLSFGDVPGREYALQLAADHLVHAWDLARALGADTTLDADAVAAVRTGSRATRTGTAPPAPSARGCHCPTAPTPRTELLAMFGRQP